MTDAPHDLASRRKDYETAGLDLPDVAGDPMEQWHRWYADANEAGCVEPNAFVLSTLGPDGFPRAEYHGRVSVRLAAGLLP